MVLMVMTLVIVPYPPLTGDKLLLIGGTKYPEIETWWTIEPRGISETVRENTTATVSNVYPVTMRNPFHHRHSQIWWKERLKSSMWRRRILLQSLTDTHLRQTLYFQQWAVSKRAISFSVNLVSLQIHPQKCLNLANAPQSHFDAISLYEFARTRFLSCISLPSSLFSKQSLFRARFTSCQRPPGLTSCVNREAGYINHTNSRELLSSQSGIA